MRLLRPGAVVFCLALLASLGVHLPVYEVLGVLAGALSESAAAPAEPIEFELAPLGEPAEAKEQAEQAKDLARTPNASAPEETPKPEPPKPSVPKVAEAEPKPIPRLAIAPPPQPTAALPPPEERNKLAVTQKSDDPSVEAPEQAEFIAEENRRVEEQTVASVTNLHEDAEQPELAPKASDTEATGDAEESEPADLRNVEGEDSRLPNEREAKAEVVEPSSPSHGSEAADAVTAAPAPGGASGAEQDKRAMAAGSAAVGGEDEPLVIEDGMGTLRIRRSLLGQGAGNQGGMQRPGATAQRAQAEGGRTGRGANLQLSWSQFENTFGASELREQRDAYLEQKRSKTRGGNHEVQWRKFRAAIENFVPNVKPGNQTALNAAASPFAAYLAEVHRRIHREFAMRFIRDLPLVGGPYDDRSLFTKLEIVINGNGTLHRTGVVQSSGFLPFDYGAWNAVERAAPYPEPPRKILSGDGRVYFRWGFARDERQCGTFNAEPYILPNIGSPPAPAPGPLHDQGDQGDPREGPDSKFGAAERAPVPYAELPPHEHVHTHAH